MLEFLAGTAKCDLGAGGGAGDALGIPHGGRLLGWFMLRRLICRRVLAP